MDGLKHDFRLAVRALVRRPGYALLVVLTLAIGMGINTVTFSAVNAVVFKPFDRAGAKDIGWLFAGTAANPLRSASVQTLDTVSRMTRTLESVAGEGRLSLVCECGGSAERVWASAVSGAFFTIVPAPTVAGRLIGAADASAGVVPVVLSERFWREHLGAASIEAIRVRLNREPVRVIGVVRDGFQGPNGIFEPDFWIPLDAHRRLAVAESLTGLDAAWLRLIARPRAGQSAAAIEADVAAIVRDAIEHPDRGDSHVRVTYTPMSDGHPEVRDLFGVGSALAVGLVGIVLFVACLNAAALVLSRTLERRRDLAVRAAIGASRWRLVQSTLVESLLLAGLAGAAALLVAFWTSGLLSSLRLPVAMPQRLHFAVDGRLIAYTSALVLVGTLAPALGSMWSVLRVDPIGWLRTGGGSVGGARARSPILIGLEAAASTVFVVAAVLFVTSFRVSARTSPGFDVDDIAVLEVDPLSYGYSANGARDLIVRLRDRLARHPDLRSAAVADRIPFYVGYADARRISPADRPCDGAACPAIQTYAVDATFFETMGIPLRAGRIFDNRTTDTSVVISQHAASTLWPDRPAVGEWFRDLSTGRSWQVAGIVADVTHRSFGEPLQPVVYRPLDADVESRAVTIVARGRAGSREAVAALARTLADLDPLVPPESVTTMRERMALPLWPSRVAATFFLACAAIGMTLVGTGLFGVAYYAVAQRRREFGLRLAVGARPIDIRRLVMRDAVRSIAPGAIAGLVLGWAAARVARAAIVGVSIVDVRVYLAAACVLGAVVLIASWWPAAQASKADALSVLRAE